MKLKWRAKYTPSTILCPLSGFQVRKKKRKMRRNIFHSLCNNACVIWIRVNIFAGHFFLLSAHLLALLCLFSLSSFLLSFSTHTQPTGYCIWHYLKLVAVFFTLNLDFLLQLLALPPPPFISFSLSLLPFICLNLYLFLSLPLSVDIWLSEKEVKVYLSQENGVCEDCISGCESHFTFSLHESRDKLTQFF